MAREFRAIKYAPLHNRRWFLWRGTPAAFLLLTAARASGAEQAGMVEEVRGEAFAEAAAIHRTLDRGAAIFLGDAVRTERNARLRMLLGRDTTLQLGEQAR